MLKCDDLDETDNLIKEIYEDYLINKNELVDLLNEESNAFLLNK